MFGPSKRDKQILDTVSKTVLEQLTGLVKIQHQDYGPGINYIMVEGKFFENEWVLAYLSGWFEAYSRATKLKEKYWTKAIELALKEADWFITEMYNNQGNTINWIKSLKKRDKTQNFTEGYEHGLREGSEAGQKIRAWIDDGVFPSEGNMLFNTLGIKLRQGNALAVDSIKKSATEGDKPSQQLLSILKNEEKKLSELF